MNRKNTDSGNGDDNDGDDKMRALGTTTMIPMVPVKRAMAIMATRTMVTTMAVASGLQMHTTHANTSTNADLPSPWCVRYQEHREAKATGEAASLRAGGEGVCGRR
jgi:hypothetical protein